MTVLPHLSIAALEADLRRTERGHRAHVARCPAILAGREHCTRCDTYANRVIAAARRLDTAVSQVEYDRTIAVDGAERRRAERHGGVAA